VSDLFWPGDERAGDALSAAMLLDAMVRVEATWLATLARAGIADASDGLGGLIGDDDLDGIARGAESGGNPVQPALSLLRERLRARDPRAAAWLHRGLTSQDVLDTAIVLCLREASAIVRRELHHQIGALSEMAQRHRADVMPGRTLGQSAVPITFGLKAAVWLGCVLDAYEDLSPTDRLPAQLGGAAGTLSAPTALAAEAGLLDPPRAAQALTVDCATALGLVPGPPWHTSRAPITRTGDAFVRCTDAWGHIANDVITMARPEIAELAEPAGHGGSSTMPHKQNPIVSVLIRRAALTAPSTASQLHLAAADSHDERSSGAWHVEWSALRTLTRHAVAAASQTTELLTGLRVDTTQMRTNAEAARTELLAERDSMSSATGDVDTYLGATDLVIDAALDRARTHQGAEH